MGIAYPITGHWISGGGWLANIAKDASGATTGSFFDFAGSTVVHSVGGWAALIGAAVLVHALGDTVKMVKIEPSLDIIWGLQLWVV